MLGSPSRRAAMTAAAFLIALAISPGVATSGEITVLDGVPHVRNSGDPADGTRRIELEVDWRAGGEDDEIFFGLVSQVLADDDRNVYLLDTQLSEVHVYSPAGEHLRTLCREGEGPGEVRRPNDMLFLPDGTLGVTQGYPGKVIKVELDGQPAGSMGMGSGEANAGQFGVLVRTICRGGNIVFGGMRMSFGGDSGFGQELFLSRCDESGNEIHRYLSKDYPLDYSNFVMDEFGWDFPWVGGRFAVGPEGRVYMNQTRDEYRIEVVSPAGELERVIELDYEPWPRDETLKQNVRLAYEATAANYPGAQLRDVIVAETEAAISDLYIRDDGSIWVRSSRGVYACGEGVLSAYDVFDPEGHHRERIEIIAPGDPSRDSVFPLEDGRVVVVTDALSSFLSMQGVESGSVDEEAPPAEVICYRYSE